MNSSSEESLGKMSNFSSVFLESLQVHEKTELNSEFESEFKPSPPEYIPQGNNDINVFIIDQEKKDQIINSTPSQKGQSINEDISLNVSSLKASLNSSLRDQTLQMEPETHESQNEQNESFLRVPQAAHDISSESLHHNSSFNISDLVENNLNQNFTFNHFTRDLSQSIPTKYPSISTSYIQINQDTHDNHNSHDGHNFHNNHNNQNIQENNHDSLDTHDINDDHDSHDSHDNYSINHDSSPHISDEEYSSPETEGQDTEYSVNQNTSEIIQRRKKLTANEISQVLHKGFTQEKAAQHFGLSLSTFKRRLIHLNFKWPRGKRQRELLGVASYTTKPSKRRYVKKEIVPDIRNETGNKVKKIVSNQLNYRLEEVIKQCQDFSMYEKYNQQNLNIQDFKDLNENQNFNYTLISTNNIDNDSTIMNSMLFNENEMLDSFFIDESGSSKDQSKDEIYKQFDMLLKENINLKRNILIRNLYMEELKSQIPSYIPNYIPSMYLGDSENLVGPWNSIDDPLVGISIVDRKFRLIASNKAWQFIMGYEHHELNLPNGFSTFHKLWPFFPDYDTVISSVNYCLNGNVKVSYAQGIYIRKNGNYVLLDYRCHVEKDYFWEEFRLAPKPRNDIIIETIEGNKVKKDHTPALQKLVDDTPFDVIYSEILGTFNDVLDLGEYVNIQKKS